LLECIVKNLPVTARRMKLLIPYAKAGFAGKIREEGKVFSEEFTETGTITDALVDVKLISEAEQYIYNA